MIEKRNPIVVVLGHVDHGKTTLLDALRKTKVADREAGGITQSIGSSVVDGITFIDTPGHALFSKMRGRGASVADIAILVVAANDGIKPQTREAIEIIKDAKIPFVVAVTKIDIAGVNPEMVRGQLEAEGILFEGRGGEIPFLPISAKNNLGLTELIETLKLLAEVNNVSGDKESELEAVVIESFKDKRGSVTNLIVRDGSLKVGQEVKISNLSGKVKAIFNDKNESLKEINPGEPGQVIGLVEEINNTPRKVLGESRRLKDDELAVIIKTANAGSLEAVVASLPEKTVVVGSGVGDVNETDVLNAKVGNARIFAFEAKIPNGVAKLADSEGVKAQRFEIIYELIAEIEDIFKKGKVEILGRAKILAIFPFNNKKVAGCKVLDGKINKSDKLILVRDEKELGKAKITSLKKQKLEVTSVGQSEEFGVIIEPQLDFKEGDILVSVK